MNEQIRHAMAAAAGVDVDSPATTIGDALLDVLRACNELSRKRQANRRRDEAWQHAIKIEVPR